MTADWTLFGLVVMGRWLDDTVEQSDRGLDGYATTSTCLDERGFVFPRLHLFTAKTPTFRVVVVVHLLLALPLQASEQLVGFCVVVGDGVGWLLDGACFRTDAHGTTGRPAVTPQAFEQRHCQDTPFDTTTTTHEPRDDTPARTVGMPTTTALPPPFALPNNSYLLQRLPVRATRTFARFPTTTGRLPLVVHARGLRCLPPV